MIHVSNILECKQGSLPILPRKYCQPGHECWPTSKQIEEFSGSINGTKKSCLGLDRFVYKEYPAAHIITCLPYNGLQPNNTDGTCRKPDAESTYSIPDATCASNPFVTGAYYNDTDNQYACMTPYQFLNNRNYKEEWMAAFIVTAESPEDIQYAIWFARNHSLGISIMSTGHDLQDRNAGPGPNTLLIRTTCFQYWDFKNETISVKNNLSETLSEWEDGYAEVGAGLTFGKNFWWNLKNAKGTYELAAQSHKETVGGTCHSVGIIGWTLGGGRGWTSPKYGLGVDQLIHVDLINANGKHVSANYTHNKNLFYALRGGGGVFGVVYRIKIKLHSPSEECNGNMTDCYTVFNYTWTGTYNTTKLPYIQSIMQTYTEWSSEHEGKSWPANMQLFYLPDGTYELFIGATNLGGNKSELESFEKSFKQFETDLQINTTIKTSKYWCEVFPDPSDGNNCTSYPWWISRWKQSIRFMAERGVINNDTNGDGLISTILKYWQPHCEKYPESICASAWQIHGDLPAIDDSTKVGVYSTGGPVSPGFRRASFNVLNLDVTSSTQNRSQTFKQDEEWMKYILGPEMYKFSNASYFNEAEYTLEPGQWERRFWGEEHHAKLVGYKKTYDPDQIFACRHCIGDEVDFNK